MLDKLLKEYILDENNADNNYNLGLYYESIGQTASAISFLLRCAERSSIKEIQYECLLRAASCFEKQGKRNFTVEGLLQHAVSILPKRPEAYYILSRFYERIAKWQYSYMIASIGEKVTEQDSSPLRNPVDYPGYYSIIFQKSVSSWWCGLCEESKNLLLELNKNYNLNETFSLAVKNNLCLFNVDDLGMSFDDFDFGHIQQNKDFYNIVVQEIFIDKVYDRFVKVEKDDIVLDIGASSGPFTYSILGYEPSKVYCLEPHSGLFEDLSKNFRDKSNVVVINAGISNQTGQSELEGVWNPDSMMMWSKSETCNTITLKSLIEKYNIPKIDFIKLDCEGGEYDLLTIENLQSLLEHNNYIKISGEFHLHNLELKTKFKWFRDNILCKLNNKEYKIYSMNNIDITKELFYDEFIDHYSCIMIYMNMKGKNMNENIYYDDNRPKEDWGCIKTNKFHINKNINKRVFVVDNFYENPDEVREFALSQTFYDDSGYLGMRTRKQFFFDGVKERFETIIGQKIIDWENQDMNGRFQTCVAGTPLVYHCDAQKWAGIVYLTPNAPVSCGTSFYMHKETKKHHNSQIDWNSGEGIKVFNQKTFLDKTPYEMVDTVGNIYNRLVIFDGGLIHAASEYFGWDIPTSRLFHMYFFN